MPYPRNREGAKTDYEPRFQRDTEEQFQNHDPVKTTGDPSELGLGHDVPDPFRLLDEKYSPRY